MIFPFFASQMIASSTLSRIAASWALTSSFGLEPARRVFQSLSNLRKPSLRSGIGTSLGGKWRTQPAYTFLEWCVNCGASVNGEIEGGPNSEIQEFGQRPSIFDF